MKRFSDLTEQEILALAVASEEEDSRIYRDFAEGLRANFPASAKVFDEMAEEETQHRHMLLELHRKKFGEHLPLIRRQDVRGFISRRPVWLVRPLGLDKVRKVAEEMEFEAARFYAKAADALDRRLHSEAAGRPRGNRARPREPRRAAGRDDPDRPTCAQEEERTGAAHVRAAIRAARPGRADGRLGVDAGAAVRRRLRHPQQLGRVPGRPCGIGRRRHQHGFRRGAVRRRLAHRPRRSVAARRRVRPDDHGRRHRAHAALPDSRFRASPPRSPSRSWWWSSPPSPISATATWTTPICLGEPCRWPSAARWCSRPAC